MNEITGWRFDLYEHPQKGVVLWIVGEDGKAHELNQDFSVAFCVGGQPSQLRDLGEFLGTKHPGKLKFTRNKTEDLFDGPQEVMGIRLADTTLLRHVFRDASQKFPDLIYSN